MNLQSKKSKTRIQHAFTLDLEEWFQGLTSTSCRPDRWHEFEPRVQIGSEVVLELLEKWNTKATVFVVGQVANRTPEVVKWFFDAGHQIGLHGHMHQLVYRMSPQSFQEDTRQGLMALKQVLGSGYHIKSYRAPAFSLLADTKWAVKILIEEGFRFDSSTVAVKNPLYGDLSSPTRPYVEEFSGGELVRIPIPVARFGPIRIPVMGGFYFRSLPSAAIYSLIDSYEAQNCPIVFYTHPWEYDKFHPFMPSNVRERVSHYHALKNLKSKLDHLLRRYEFAPIEDVFSSFILK